MHSFRTIALLAAVAAGWAQPPAPALRPHLLVSTAWLAQHLADPEVVLVHVADTYADYKRGHIPGARFLATGRIAESTPALQTELPTLDKLVEAFRELGIGDRSRVVIYTTAWPPNAARAWWTLDWLGHGERTALLDGGVDEWLAEDRPVTQQVPAFKPLPFTPKVREAARATLAQAQQAADGKAEGLRLLDARPARRYEAGHLPGATHLFWQDTLQGEAHPLFLPPDRLRALYAARGLAPGATVVTYCEVGLQAAHAYFLARYLGYDAAMYDGSFQEWSAKNLPVVKGTAPR